MISVKGENRMDQQKTGAFLRALRNEKGMTQEQLAEQFLVSGRSVSRWETGRNMPELSILVELAEFYDVDIREIIDGERKSEKMNEELKESVLKVAEYADNEKSVLLKRMRMISVMGVCGAVMTGVLEWAELSGKLPVFSYLAGAGVGLAVGALLVMLLYTHGVMEKVVQYKCRNGKALKIAALVVVAVGFACAVFASMI